MKMINDMDMFYADAYSKETVPAWMKAERIDFCETGSDHTRNLLSRLMLRSRKAN